MWAILLVFKYVPNKSVSPVKSDSKLSYSFVKSKNYLLSTFIYVFAAFSQYWYKSILALWLRLDRNKQGLSWDSELSPGIMNGFSGFFLLFFPILFTSRIQNKFGLRGGFVFLAFLLVLPMCIISYGYFLTDIWLMVFLILNNGLINAFITILMSYISIAVSNSVHGNVAGAAIGLAQAFSALGRAIGNGAGSNSFGYLQSEDFGFPFDFHFTFFFTAAVLLVMAGIVKFMLDDNIEKRKVSQVEIPLIKKE